MFKLVVCISDSDLSITDTGRLDRTLRWALGPDKMPWLAEVLLQPNSDARIFLLGLCSLVLSEVLLLFPTHQMYMCLVTFA